MCDHVSSCMINVCVQELHERRVTLLEGSAVSVRDLVAARAEKARACLLLADRFTTDPEQEDLSILFQVTKRCC